MRDEGTEAQVADVKTAAQLGIQPRKTAAETAPLSTIAHEESESMPFREMTVAELSQESFSDYFRFSFTMRMDRDEALAMKHKLERYVEEIKTTHDHCRVYLGVKNPRQQL